MGQTGSKGDWKWGEIGKCMPRMHFRDETVLILEPPQGSMGDYPDLRSMLLGFGEIAQISGSYAVWLRPNISPRFYWI